MKVTNDLAYFSMEIITTIERGSRYHTYKTFTGINKPTFSEIDKHSRLPEYITNYDRKNIYSTGLQDCVSNRFME